VTRQCILLRQEHAPLSIGNLPAYRHVESDPTMWPWLALAGHGSTTEDAETTEANAETAGTPQAGKLAPTVTRHRSPKKLLFGLGQIADTFLLTWKVRPNGMSSDC
jgi:hypothetical protein